MKQSKQKNCNVCSSPFTPFKSTQKSCCYGCAKIHEDANTKQKFCNVCNKSFIPYKSTIKSCSFECAKKHEESKPKKKVKLIAPMSKKLASRLVVYRIRRDTYMKTNTVCEFIDCASPSNDLHHKAGRIGENLINEENFMSVCRRCHTWIHEHPKESRELNYLK